MEKLTSPTPEIYLKKCSKCGEKKTLDAFSRDKSIKTGYRPSCKVCDRSAINKQARREYEKQYWTGDRAEKKKAGIKLCRERNLERYNATQAAYRQTEEFKEHHRAHAAIRRARMRNVLVENVNYRKVYEESTKKCAYCEKPLMFDDVEFDHFIPISKGGSHERSNIRVSCLPCNRTKGAKLPAEVCDQMA